MCRVQVLRSLVTQRLTAATEEMLGLVERTIEEYQEEYCGPQGDRQRLGPGPDVSKRLQTLRELVNQCLTAAVAETFALIEKTVVEYEEEIQRRTEDAVTSGAVTSGVQVTTDSPQLFVFKVELDQQDPNLLPHVKEEQNEIWTSQAVQQEPAEPTSNSAPASDVQPTCDGRLSSDCSETDDSDDEGWKKSESQSCSDTLTNNKSHRANMRNLEPRRKFDFKFKERVLRYAEENSGEKAARHFNIDSRQIRYWKKQKGELLTADKSRSRLNGGGRKKVSAELEHRLSEWIYSMRDKHKQVSRKMIMDKALEIYQSVSDGGKMFVASRGWLQRFLQRNLSLRRSAAATTQKDLNLLTEKLVSFVDYVGKAVGSKGIVESDIIAMDETAVWFDAALPATLDTRGTKRVAQKSHVTVVLAAKADGTKLKPYIVFRGAVRDVTAMRQQIPGAVVAFSVSGFMNDALTADWLQSVVGKFNSTPRLLVWDSYRSHISAATKAELKCGYDITTAVIPGGCTKYIHAPEVMWNQPFKQSLHDAYDQWMAGDANEESAAGGNVKALVDWVVAAWEKLDADLIRKSFRVCGQSVKSDGSEDNLILCFGKGQPCATGREALARRRRRGQEKGCEVAQEEEDEEELFNNELVLEDEGEDHDEDFGEEDSE